MSTFQQYQCIDVTPSQGAHPAKSLQGQHCASPQGEYADSAGAGGEVVPLVHFPTVDLAIWCGIVGAIGQSVYYSYHYLDRLYYLALCSADSYAR